MIKKGDFVGQFFDLSYISRAILEGIIYFEVVFGCSLSIVSILVAVVF